MINDTEIIDLIKKAEEGPTLDYKEDLLLDKDGDKAEFVKDVIALANSGEIAHILLGVEDKTGRLVGFKTHHTAEQINQILKDKCDPPISVEYIEKNLLGYEIGVIEIKGDSSPYIVSVPDKFGGKLSSNPNKSFHIQRGTVYVRNYNITQGAKRADLDKIYDKKKYVALQADLILSHEITIKPLNGSKEVDITFCLHNLGDALATDTFMYIIFNNIRKIVKCYGVWSDQSEVSKGALTISATLHAPIVRPIKNYCRGVIVNVDKEVEQIETYAIISSTNMRAKEGPYYISLKEQTS